MMSGGSYWLHDCQVVKVEGRQGGKEGEIERREREMKRWAEGKRWREGKEEGKREMERREGGREGEGECMNV